MQRIVKSTKSLMRESLVRQSRGCKQWSIPVDRKEWMGFQQVGRERAGITYLHNSTDAHHP
jgi:hypothetical protein